MSSATKNKRISGGEIRRADVIDKLARAMYALSPNYGQRRNGTMGNMDYDDQVASGEYDHRDAAEAALKTMEKLRLVTGVRKR